MTRKALAEIMINGAMLGSLQLALAFSILCNAGAAITNVFLFVFFWLLGSAAVLQMPPLLRRPGRLLCAALALGLLSIAVLLWRSPVGTLPLYLVAAFSAGMYAASFLNDRSTYLGSARAVLLHENNGFLLGYLASAGLLFMSFNAVFILLGVLSTVSIILLIRRHLAPSSFEV